MRTRRLLFRPGILLLVPFLSINPSHAAVQSVQGAAGSIAGKVAGLDSSSVGTATVQAWNESPERDSIPGVAYKGFARVDSNFTYRIDNLSPGDFYVTAWAEGYEAQYYNGAASIAGATKVKVRENVVTSGIDFNLTKPTPGTGSISGTVLDENDGKPVPNATVSVYEPDHMGIQFYYGKEQTNSAGHYTITGLKSGSYTAQVYAEDYVWEMYDHAGSDRDAKRIQVTEPNETAGIVIRIERSGSISGKVTDAKAKPINKAVITAYSYSKDSVLMYPFKNSDSFQQTGYSDSSGQYRIEGLKKGKYLVMANIQMEWDGYTQWYSKASSETDADSVSVQSGDTTQGIDFQFHVSSATGSVSGTVKDQNGLPVAHAGIYVVAPSSSVNGSRSMRYASTDSTGRYTADKLTPGEYVVQCWAQVGWQSTACWWPDAETQEQAGKITVIADSSITGIDFRLTLKRETGSISGKVVSSGGQFLRNASIQLQTYYASNQGKTEDQVSIWAYANSDSFGQYTIQQLPAGKYLIHASHWENDRYGQEWYKGKSEQSQADPIVLIEGQQTFGVDFSLTVKPLYGTIAGTVQNGSTGEPIPRAFIEITPLKNYIGFAPFRMWNHNTRTDEKGRYSVEWLTEGEYLIAVYANGGFAYYKNAPVAGMADTVKLEGGQKITADVSLILRNDGKGTISGSVISDWGSNASDSSFAIPLKNSLRLPALSKGSPIELAVVKAKPAVTILSYPQSELIYTALTDSAGRYTLKGLPDGEYFLSSFAPYHMLEYYDNAIDPAKATLIRIENGRPIEGVDFALSPMLLYYRNAGPEFKDNAATTGLFGKVEDSNGNAIEGATVYLLNSSGEPIGVGQTNANGAFEISDVPQGNYYLQASKLGYGTQYNGSTAEIFETVPLNIVGGMNEVNFTLAAITRVGPSDPEHPSSPTLYGNYPNPFNPETRIAFGLPARSHVVLRIFNMLGQEITVLCDKNFEAGRHEAVWRGIDTNGKSMPSGIYFYRWETPTSTRTGKMVLMR